MAEQPISCPLQVPILKNVVSDSELHPIKPYYPPHHKHGPTPTVCCSPFKAWSLLNPIASNMDTSSSLGAGPLPLGLPRPADEGGTNGSKKSANRERRIRLSPSPSFLSLPPSSPSLLPLPPSFLSLPPSSPSLTSFPSPHRGPPCAAAPTPWQAQCPGYGCDTQLGDTPPWQSPC